MNIAVWNNVRLKSTSFVFAGTMLLISIQACKHEPLVVKSTTGDGSLTECDPTKVYFEQQVLPILNTYCAKSGCHDPVTHEGDVILNNYDNVIHTADVEAFNLHESKLWKVITDNDPDDHMPPPGEPQLTQDQINLIGEWITQGAENLFCDADIGPCDTVNMSYSLNIVPIIQQHCIGCHATATTANNMVNLSNYAGVMAVASTGVLTDAITRITPPATIPDMPKGVAMSACKISKIKNWVAQGYPNN